MNALEQEINRLISKMFADQSEDGAWHYPFETGIATDCYMIILLRTLELDDEELIKGLVDRIVSKQLVNGAWKLFYDEEDGNLSATLEAYYALLSSGYVKKKDPMMQKAKRFILSKGGVTEAQLFTKIMLAMNGQYEWPILPVPILAMLLPKTFPINLYDVSIYGRANLVPILVLADKSFTIKRDPSPDLSDLIVYRERAGDASDSENYRSLLSEINHGIQMLADLPENLYSEALKRAEEYMLERIEPDGTFLNFFSSTFLMIFALISLGYSKNDSRIRHAMQGLKSMVTLIDGKLHCQYTTATVWNTALISYTLQEAGVPASNAVIHKANRYLLTRQHYKWGDWRFHNPNVQPGGWGFSNFNTINPDVDDTTAALRAIRVNAVSDDHYKKAWKKGVEWVVSMQNDDGGWPAFERNVNEKWLDFIPIEGGRDLLIDPSTVDLTGRTLEFFGNYTNLDEDHPIIQRGVEWIIQNQKEDGSWVGRWGVYIYGTWAAISGLIASGVSPSHPSVQRGINWLKAIQNSDGGWGESCASDIVNHYVPLGVSTRTHTAWALDALITAEDVMTPEIEKGLAFLLHHQVPHWTASYPKGRGMAGAFYIHYHCYEYVWPLVALAHFKKKFTSSQN